MKWRTLAVLFALLTLRCGSSNEEPQSPEARAEANVLNDAPTGSRCGGSELPKVPPFDPAASVPGTLAVAKDDSRIQGFATSVQAVRYGSGVDDQWKVSEQALGEAEGNSNDVVVLGEGGTITLSFDEAVSNHDGPELCVFENSFSDDFLELGFVEVASDARSFIRFATASFTAEPVGPFGTIDPTQVFGFAGKYRQGYCTPFDLGTLSDRQEVRDGLVDLTAIRYVRIVDVEGSGASRDCNGNAIYDPYPSRQTAGFDLDAVARL